MKHPTSTTTFGTFFLLSITFSCVAEQETVQPKSLQKNTIVLGVGTHAVDNSIAHRMMVLPLQQFPPQKKTSSFHDHFVDHDFDVVLVPDHDLLMHPQQLYQLRGIFVVVPPRPFATPGRNRVLAAPHGTVLHGRRSSCACAASSVLGPFPAQLIR